MPQDDEEAEKETDDLIKDNFDAEMGEEDDEEDELDDEMVII